MTIQLELNPDLIMDWEIFQKKFPYKTWLQYPISHLHIHAWTFTIPAHQDVLQSSVLVNTHHETLLHIVEGMKANGFSSDGLLKWELTAIVLSRLKPNDDFWILRLLLVRRIEESDVYERVGSVTVGVSSLDWKSERPNEGFLGDVQFLRRSIKLG